MKKVKEILSFVWELLRGKKSYIAGGGALVYALIQKDLEMLIIGLGLIGVRHGIGNEIKGLVDALNK